MRPKLMRTKLPRGCIVYMNGYPVRLQADVWVEVAGRNHSAVEAFVPRSGKVTGLPLQGLELLQR